MTLSRNILVTGATGFVGSALLKELYKRDYIVRGAVRNSPRIHEPCKGFEYINVGDVNEFTDWSNALSGIDCVVHCAARAHHYDETATEALQCYRSVNVAGTIELAHQASLAGCKKLIYLSSIKVNGERTYGDMCFTSDDMPRPEDAYGISKFEAEQALHQIAKSTGLEVVIIRPPLIYGPNVKGNLARLLKVVDSGFPLPLGSVNNCRSLLGLDNLLDFIVCCLDNPEAIGQTFLLSDDEHMSTKELISLIARNMCKKTPMFKFPLALIKYISEIIGRDRDIERLVSSLRVDDTFTRNKMKWMPIKSASSGIKQMVDAYLAAKGRV